MNCNDFNVIRLNLNIFTSLKMKVWISFIKFLEKSDELMKQKEKLSFLLVNSRYKLKFINISVLINNKNVYTNRNRFDYFSTTKKHLRIV